MATQRKRGGPQTPATEPTPVQGAAWTQGDAAMTVLLERFAQIDATLKQFALQINAVQTAQTDQAKQLAQAVADQKEQSAQALMAAKEALVKLQEAAPKDPRVLDELVRMEKVKAGEQARKKRARFAEHIKNCPTGSITNHTLAPLTVGVNGFKVVIPPETTANNIPAPFIEAYERTRDMQKWAAEQDRKIRAEGGEFVDYGQLQNWRADNSVSTVDKPAITMWDEDGGTV